MGLRLMVLSIAHIDIVGNEHELVIELSHSGDPFDSVHLHCIATCFRIACAECCALAWSKHADDIGGNTEVTHEFTHVAWLGFFGIVVSQYYIERSGHSSWRDTVRILLYSKLLKISKFAQRLL